MEYTSEQQLILNSLNKDRKELSEQLGAIDKIIKKIKYGTLNLGSNRVLKQGNDESQTFAKIRG